MELNETRKFVVAAAVVIALVRLGAALYSASPATAPGRTADLIHDLIRLVNEFGPNPDSVRNGGVHADTATADTPTADTPTADTPTADTPTADTPTADTPTADTDTTTTVSPCTAHLALPTPGCEYIVQPGDGLIRIARKISDAADACPGWVDAIFEENRSGMPNPDNRDLLHAGQVLRVPVAPLGHDNPSAVTESC